MEAAAAPDAVDAFDAIADVLPRILALLGPRDLARLACTSRHFRALADEPALWRDCLAHEAALCVAPLAAVNGNEWKAVYRARRPVASLEAWVGALAEGDALLLPSGRYAGFSLPPAAPLVAIVGLPNARGEPVVIAGAPPHNLLELTGAGLVLRHVTLRFPEAPAPPVALRAWPAVVYVAGGRLEMEDCRIEGGARQWGVALQHKATAVLRRCAVTNLLDSPLSLWEGCGAEADECDFHNVGQMQVRGATARFRRCTMLLKDAYEARLCFVGQGADARFEDCRLTGRGHRCSGVSSWGAVTLTRCTLDAFYFALTKRDQPPVSASECKFSAHPRGGNAFLSSGRGPVAFAHCEFAGAFTSAIEVEEHGTLQLTACRFAKAQCAVGLHGADSAATLDACVFRECDTALKVGVAARATPRDCSFVRCERGVHLTGNPAALAGEEAALRHANVFERCGAAVVVEAMEGGADADDGVAPEVRQAVARGVCTFQVTGPHYRKQMVWRCNTCRLNNSRGVCAVCKERCHAGHELEPTFETVRFFCDCGAERFCDTLRRAAPALH